MAAYGPAAKRCKYIITGEKKYRQQTPGTISGFRAREYTWSKTGNGSILSYQKIIGLERPDGSWTVNTERDSPTTNRHVRALCMALDELDIPYTEGPLW